MNEELREALAELICGNVAELGDRNSPEDWPEAMLVTHDELRLIVIEALATPQAAAPAGKLTGAAAICDGLAELMENGAGELEPGGRLRQAARLIRELADPEAPSPAPAPSVEPAEPTHELKCWPDPFEAMLAGDKTAEFRLNDRGFKVGDTIRLREWRLNSSVAAPEHGHDARRIVPGGYTGRALDRRITHILDAGFRMPEDYVMLSLAAPSAPQAAQAPSPAPAPSVEPACRTCHGWGNVHGMIDGEIGSEKCPDCAAPSAPAREQAEPARIDMVLPCPACGKLHVDAPEPCRASLCEYGCACPGDCIAWTNPPHKSHLCHGCGHVWRPADVPTNGVAAVKTKGKADSPAPATRATESGATVQLYEQIDHLRANLRSVVDAYASLLDDGKFPAPRNRTADEKERVDAWWEDSHARVKRACEAIDHPDNAPQHGERGNK